MEQASTRSPERREDLAAQTSTHHFAEGLGVLWELAGVFLLHLFHQSLHFLPLDLLPPLLEGRLALNHLVQQAAKRPPVRAESVALVFHHLRSWRTDKKTCSEILICGLLLCWSDVTYTCIRLFPPVPWWSAPLVHELLNPGLISWCGLRTQTHAHAFLNQFPLQLELSFKTVQMVLSQQPCQHKQQGLISMPALALFILRVTFNWSSNNYNVHFVQNPLLPHSYVRPASG